MKNNKGISLIVLIITIIVMIILASVVVMTFKNTNPVGRANEAKFKSDLSGFRDELLATHSDKEISDPDYVREDINVDIGNSKGLKEYIPDITEKYSKKLFIKKGKLLYIGDDTSPDYNATEEIWAKDIGIQAPYGNVGDADGDGEVTAEDLIFIQRAVGVLNPAIDVNTLNARQKKAFDVKEDGVINIDDSTAIQRFLSGLITSLPYKGTLE